MTNRRFHRWFCVCLLLSITPTIGSIAQFASAAEPAQKFLEGLRDRGYFDMAMRYLDQMESSPLAPVQFKAAIAYERGVTLIQYGRTQRDVASRQKYLGDAEKELTKFKDENAQHPLASAAKGQLANLLVERARMDIERANRKSTSADENTALLEAARAKFDKARSVFEESKADLKAKLERIPPGLDPNNPNQKRMIAIRDQWRQDYLQARLLIPAIKEEKADTYDEGSEQRKTLLLEAAKDFNECYQAYRTRIAGLYARMYQGRCFVKLKDYKEALSFFNDLFEQPDSSEFRDLKKRTMILAVDCWLREGEKSLYNDAILKIGGMIDQINPNEAREEDWLYLRLKLADSYKAYGDDVTEKAEKGQALGKARTHYQYVVKFSRDYKREAQEKLAKMRGIDDLPEEEKKEPRNFAEARDRAKELLDGWQTAKIEVAGLQKQIAGTSDAQVKAELQTQLKDAVDRLNQSPHDSLKYFQRALELADDETTSDDMNIARYFMAFLHFTLGQYHEAGVVGEFVARRYPNTPGATQCAQIALAAHVQIYNAFKNAEPDKEHQFEIDRIVGIGDYMIAAWSDKAEAVTAASTLIAFMINAKEMDKARDYLNRIPENSPNRGSAELNTGQAFWSVYLARKKEAKDNPTVPINKAELESLKDDAKKYLKDGIERLRKAPVSETLLTATLSLAQVYVDTSEAALSIELLEDQEIGPLKYVKEKHPAAEKPGLAVETYKTALRAYIASLKPGGDNNATIEKAKEMMNLMKQLMGSSPEGKKALIGTYIKLASDIKVQFDEAKNISQKKSMAVGFSSFLKEVGSGSKELNILNWVADSYSRMGESFADSDKDEAKKYLSSAIEGFDAILKQGKSQAGWLDPKVRTQVLMRKAATMSFLGEHENAISVFSEMLKEKSSQLNIQVEAAKVYQSWADKTKKKDLYLKAIKGGGDKDKGGKSVIWGWSKVAKVTGSYPQFKDISNEARFNYYYCMVKYYGGDKDKLKKTKDGILKTKLLNKNFGGPDLAKKYNQLLKDIDKAL